jgi:hypothetical protein
VQRALNILALFFPRTKLQFFLLQEGFLNALLRLSRLLKGIFKNLNTMPMENNNMGSDKLAILWFRHGLRLHDNPSLHAAIEAVGQGSGIKLLPIFIFDGETAGTGWCGYNRMTYLLECLKELDDRFRAHDSRLHIFRYDILIVFSFQA